MSARVPPPLLASAALVSSLSVLLPLLPAGSVSAPAVPAARPAHQAAMLAPAAARPVPPRVREVAVPAVRRPGATATSRPQRVDGFAVVGATWTGATPAGLRVAVRSRSGRQWSPWTRLGVEVGHHGPDPAGAEARADRPGTDPLVVGDVDLVQMRAASGSGRLPAGLRLSLVNPGSSRADDDRVRPTSLAPRTAAVVGRAPRPRIRSRSAWGADERLRSRPPTFGTVRAGFVHHTVNTNGYSRRDVPAIIRGIYAFHTQSRGWSDIGYNFLVDRFGRIWEGRFGGPARNVIGAHTFGFNHVSFAMAAIGNFETARPSPAVRRAYGRLMAWKLGLNNVRAGSRRQRMEGRVLRAISGHRDAGQTACPGIRLYRRIPAIRRIAVRLQQRGAPPAPTPDPPPAPDPPAPTATPTGDSSGPGGPGALPS